MCGRLSIAFTPSDLAREFPDVHDDDALDALDLPRYDVAPPQTHPTIVADGDGARRAALEWRLTPRWAREQTRRFATFNARAEDLTTKPSFRDRRCLVVGASFYEWKREGKSKRPFGVGLADRSPLALAGVWDR